jgi:hypothetical protein
MAPAGVRVPWLPYSSLYTWKGKETILMASFKQLKVSIEPDLADSFKTACINAGVSMAAEPSAFMAVRAGTMAVTSAKAAKIDGYDTRAKRRRHISRITTQLETIMGYEDAYRANTPENLQSGPAYENAESAIDSLEQAIDLLKDTY